MTGVTEEMVEKAVISLQAVIAGAPEITMRRIARAALSSVIGEGDVVVGAGDLPMDFLPDDQIRSGWNKAADIAAAGTAEYLSSTELVTLASKGCAPLEPNSIPALSQTGDKP